MRKARQKINLVWKKGVTSKLNGFNTRLKESQENVPKNKYHYHSLYKEYMIIGSYML